MISNEKSGHRSRRFLFNLGHQTTESIWFTEREEKNVQLLAKEKKSNGHHRMLSHKLLFAFRPSDTISFGDQFAYWREKNCFRLCTLPFPPFKRFFFLPKKGTFCLLINNVSSRKTLCLYHSLDIHTLIWSSNKAFTMSMTFAIYANDSIRFARNSGIDDALRWPLFGHRSSIARAMLDNRSLLWFVFGFSNKEHSLCGWNCPTMNWLKTPLVSISFRFWGFSSEKSL